MKYSEEFGLLLHEDMMRVLAALPREVGEYLRDTQGVYLAGGFIRSIISNEAPSDIDLFLKEGGDPHLTAESLAHGEELFTSEFAHTIPSLVHGYLVQVIDKWRFASPEDIIRHFDFTIAQAVIWYESRDTRPGWRSKCSHQFYQDLAGRRLHYNRYHKPDELDAGGTLLRVMKFVKRGFNISPEDLADIVFEVSRDCGTPQDIVNILREVDPANPPTWIEE